MRYPIVELAVGFIFIVSYNHFGISHFFIHAAWLTSLIVITAIDLEHQIIPDVISLPGILIGLALSFFAYIPVPFWESVIGAFLGGAIFFTIAYLSRGGMGGGDIKLIAMIGSFLGWQKMLLTIFISSLSGSIIGVILMGLGKKGRKSKIPYGPFLALGGAIALFFGDWLIELYLAFTL
jgi:leader peptidase (prepilin peptidase)/N-methyltransferase